MKCKGDERMSVLTITKDNFDIEVIQSEKPVLLDFWASWCGPCKMVSPIVDEIGEEVTNIKVGKVNVDEEPDLAQAFKIMSIPSLIVIENGKVKRTSIGAQPKQKILDLLKP